MYYVMSAECVDGGIEPFLHAICENEEDAAEEVARVAKSLDMDIVRGTNSDNKWTAVRYDDDGLLVWDHSDPECMKTVVAKWVDTTQRGVCA